MSNPNFPRKSLSPVVSHRASLIMRGQLPRKRRRSRRRQSKLTTLHEEESGVRGGAKMREFLRDAEVNPYDIRLPFSARQIGIYHEVLLAGTEDIQRRRELLRIMEEHGRGPFGGPPNSTQADYPRLQVST